MGKVQTAGRGRSALAVAAFVTVAAAGQLPAWAGAGSGSDEAEAAGQLTAIIVTATKRNEDIKDIPTSVSAVDADFIASHHLVSYDDLTRTVPGVSFQAGAGPGLDNIAIRGVSSTSGAATVGIYLDEVSVTVRNTFDGAVQPKPFDMDRVEVLRGPQGTLYGASSMGGTIRFITNKPDMNESSLSGSTDFSYTDHGGLNNDSYAILNLPVVAGKFALRVGVDVSYLSGYINRYAPTATGNGVGTDGNPLTLYTNDSTGVLSRRGANDVRTEVARVVGKYMGDNGLTITPEILYQHTSSGDSSLYFPAIGLYAQDKHVSEPGDDHLFVPSVTVAKSFDAVELTSVTSYFRRDFARTSDGTIYNSSIFANYLLPPALLAPPPPGAIVQPVPTAAQLTQAANIIGFSPSPVYFDTNTNQISQEVRLASRHPVEIGVPMNWQVGLYFTNQRQGHVDYETIPGLRANFQQIFGYSIYDSYIGSVAIPGVSYANDLLYFAQTHYSERQIAPFGELGFELTPDLKATVGLRYVSAKATDYFVPAGFFTVGLPSPYSESATYSATTPKFSLDYALNRDINLYASVAKGFRLGGPTGPDPAYEPNGAPPAAPGTCDQDYQNLGIPGAPLKYDSDSLWSYELGSKGRYLDNRLSVNAAVYMINWQNIQQTIVLPICGFTFTTNAGNADIFGSELEVRALVTHDWTVSLNAGNNHSYITKSLVPGIVAKGEELLSVPNFSATLSSDYVIPLSDDKSLVVRMDFPWVGRSHAFYAATTVPYHYNPAYGVLNMSVGLLQKNFQNSRKKFSLSLYAQNLTDSRKNIQYPAVFQVQQAYILRPLTVGISASLLQ